jgi:hypothetical protein
MATPPPPPAVLYTHAAENVFSNPCLYDIMHFVVSNQCKAFTTLFGDTLPLPEALVTILRQMETHGVVAPNISATQIIEALIDYADKASGAHGVTLSDTLCEYSSFIADRIDDLQKARGEFKSASPPPPPRSIELTLAGEELDEWTRRIDHDAKIAHFFNPFVK